MNVNILFEHISEVQKHIDEFNAKLNVLDEKKRKICTIHSMDSSGKISKKCKVAKRWGVYHAPLWGIYGDKQPESNPPAPDTIDSGDSSVDELKGLAGSRFTYPMSSGPDDDYQLKDEAMSSTERVRKYYKRHPEKVRKYLKDTVKDRVARNRDRKKAVKKYGKSKMKNHDVHHPNGPNGGSWRLAKKDHGRDKKNENLEYVFLSELLEGNVPNGPWSLISEGGAAGHLAHPYEDDTLTFTDVKEMVKRGLVGGLDAEAPVTEKLDGQNIMFTVRDGQVVFARNKGQIKNRGKNALPASDLRQMFAGRGNIEKAFGNAADDLTKAIDALPQDQRNAMFSNGSKFMNVEVIFPDTRNVIPYDKSVLVFHGTVEYDEEGNEIGRNVEDSKVLSNQITQVNAQQQKTFGISGPRSIAFSDADTVRDKEKMKEYGSQIARIQNEYGLDDKSTIEDYKREWWSREIDNTGIDWTPDEKEGLISRWALGDKKFGVKNIEDPEKKKFFREYEATKLANNQKVANRPLESIFLRVGADTLRRVTNTLSANNPQLTASLKKELLDTIKILKDTDDVNKLAKLQTQIERLDDIGIDKVVPTEGLVFIYNGKPYKFTGTFAPVNQILGTLKFAKGKAEEVPVEEPTKEPEKTTTEPMPSGERKTVAIFTGRFQPFHAGHYSVYQSMVNKFGKDNVYIASTDKTDATTSPFAFKDKKQIMTRMFGIPDDKVVQVKRPYAPTEILEKLPPDTVYVTAVSQKDAERLGGKYFQPYDEKGSKKAFADQGYFMVAPEMQLQVNGKNISGTQLRFIMGNPNIKDEVKKEIFTKVYGKFDPDIFKKIVKTTTDSEEALKLTAQHGEKTKKPKEKPTVQKEPVTRKKVKIDQDKSDDASQYQPGQTWKTTGGNFGGKNKKNQIKYFGTQEKAKLYATK